MPLSFQSLSHGTVAFGFFNIDTDMLLLEHCFFFATDFCRAVEGIAEGAEEADIEAYPIPDAWSIGDLQTAIHGVRYTGFIGDVYREFPFPEDKKDFKQKPEGWENQALMRMMIAKYAEAASLTVATDAEKGEVRIGEFRFDPEAFRELVLYVWQGGYPRWRDDQRPGYVEAMKASVARSSHGLFTGLESRL